MSDRCLIGMGDAALHTVADRFPVADTATLELPARPPKRAAQTAKLELRFGAVEIARPVNETDRTLPRGVRLRLVEVREVDAPEGEEPLRWLLLTTHAVDDLSKAWLIVSWYKLPLDHRGHARQVQDAFAGRADGAAQPDPGAGAPGGLGPATGALCGARADARSRVAGR